jgi:CRP-like cAMP-binding protein
MSCGCAFFAWITGRITQLLTQRLACEERFRDRIEDVSSFMDTRNFPTMLREKILDFYKVKYPNKRTFDQQEIVQDIDAPALQRWIMLHLFKDVMGNDLETKSMFHLWDIESLKELCLKLHGGYCMPGMILTRAGTDPDALYVVRFGTIRLLGEDYERIGGVGEMFGEIALLGLSPTGKRLRTTQAISVVEWCKLSKTDLEEVLEMHPHMWKSLRQVSQIHISMLRELGHRSQVATQAALAATRDQLEGNTVFSKERFAKATAQIKVLEDAARDAQKLYIDRLHHVDWTVLMQRLENIRQNEAARLKAESNEDHLEEAQRIEFLYSRSMLVTTLRFTIRSLVAPLADALPNPVHGGTRVKFNRGPQGNVGIKCEKFGFGAKITGLSPDGPAFLCGTLAVGDVIISVDDEALESLSLVEIVKRLKGEAGSEITLYIHSRGTCVKFNRGPQGNVGIKCEKFGFGAKITGLSPDGPAFFCAKLAVGDIIISVDDEALESLSLVEIVQRLKGEAGSEITLYIHSRGTAVESDGGREGGRERASARASEREIKPHTPYYHILTHHTTTSSHTILPHPHTPYYHIPTHHTTTGCMVTGCMFDHIL